MTKYRVGVEFNEAGKVIKRFPVEKSLAESSEYVSKGNFHEVSISVPINSDGYILSIMRNKNLRVHPGKYSAPAGHVDVINDVLELESPLDAIDRELTEETNLESKVTKTILKDKVLYDSGVGHFAYPFVQLIEDSSVLKFSEREIDIENSGFVEPETLDERIKKESEKFSPIAYKLFSNFFAEYGTTKESITDLINSL